MKLSDYFRPFDRPILVAAGKYEVVWKQHESEPQEIPLFKATVKTLHT